MATLQREKKASDSGGDIIVPGEGEQLRGIREDFTKGVTKAFAVTKTRFRHIYSRDSIDAERVAQLITETEEEKKKEDAGILEKHAPKLAELIENPAVQQAITVAFNVFVKYIYPATVKTWALAVKIHSTTEVELLNAAYGLAIAFFGGYFAVTIAAMEAAKMCGWETTLKALHDLHENYSLALEAHYKDNKEDLDNDGIADVDQITKQALVQRKIKVLAKAIDPEKCSAAIGGLWVAWLSVMTTLKFRYAKTVALGVSLGQMLREPAITYAVPALVKVIPREHYKWINVIVSYTCKLIGVSIAWTIQSIQSAFQSAIKGGFLFADGMIKFLDGKGKIPADFDIEKMKVREGVCALIAIAGFWFQMRNGLQLPFPMNILLLPLRIVEWFLRWEVSTFEMPAGAVAE